MSGARRSVALCATAFGLLSGSGAHATSNAAIGESGQIYSVVRSQLGQVQPSAPADRRDWPVLALETRDAGEVVRVLVPGTDDAYGESFESVVFESSSRTVYAVWQGYVGIHPVVYVAGYSGGRWAAPILVTRDAFSSKFSPQLVVTRDASGQGASRIERTILHVVYAQEDASGAVDTLYAPVVLHNGVYVGPHGIYRLNDMVVGGAPPAYPISPILARRPSLRRGYDDRSVAVAFVDGVSGQLVTLEVGFVPLQLSHVAGEARAQVIIVGSRGIGARGTAERAAFADELRTAVYADAQGEGYTAEAADALADAVHAVATDEPGSDATAMDHIAGEARAQVIIVGVRGRNHGLEAERLADAYVVSSNGDANGGDEDIHFGLAASRQAPRTSGELENRIHTSADGGRVVASWTDGLRFVRYRETSGEGWSEPREIRLSADLKLDAALLALDARVDD
jgi:hypothetical protein